MNWKLIFSLSAFGVALGLWPLLGVAALFLWPIAIVISVCLISSRASGRFALHGFAVGAMIQLWAGAISAYYIFDLSRVGIVEVTPHNIHPQIINALRIAAAAAVIAALVWLSTKLERRRIHQAVK